MTGQEIRTYLDEHGVRPNRQLGQNFLIDPNCARWIVSQLDPQPQDTIVEVGPGTGALTEHLLGKVHKLILIEFDARLAAALQQRFTNNPSVIVHHQDAVKFQMPRLFCERPVKFLGNLPYSAGGAIMKNFLTPPHPFERAVIMLQKEVIDRLNASPRSKDYGVLTLRVQSAWHVHALRTIPPEAFFPRPQIDSSVAMLLPRNDLPIFHHPNFDELIRRGFAQRRKQLKKNLPDNANWSEIAQRMNLSDSTRAEELNLMQWIELANFYDPQGKPLQGQNPHELFDVVDENDQVLRQVPRQEVHAQNLIHRAAHVRITYHNEKRNISRVLLQKRSRLKDLHPSRWDNSATGHVNAGETYIQAAKREIQEEIGLTPDQAEQLIYRATLPPSEQTGWEFIALFDLKISSSHHEFPASEVEATLFLEPQEIDHWLTKQPNDFTPAFALAWAKFREFPI